MQRVVLFSAAVLAVAILAACTDRPERKAPTEAKAPKASLSTSGVDAAAAGSSTVCVAYVKERDAARQQLAGSPTDPELQEKVTSLNDVIADACN